MPYYSILRLGMEPVLFFTVRNLHRIVKSGCSIFGEYRETFLKTGIRLTESENTPYNIK